MAGNQDWRKLLETCPQGHYYTKQNTYINPKHGFRVCRTCRRLHKRKYKERLKEEMKAIHIRNMR